MWQILLGLTQWINQRASERALRIGKERIREFHAAHPYLLQSAKEEGQVVGFYINKRGGIDSNYHLFPSFCQARSWAVSRPHAGATHVFFCDYSTINSVLFEELEDNIDQHAGERCLS
jgi:hypothetical protein